MIKSILQFTCDDTKCIGPTIQYYLSEVEASTNGWQISVDEDRCPKCSLSEIDIKSIECLCKWLKSNM